MAKKILILQGSPKRDGNTAALVDWVGQGARDKGAEVEVISAAFLKYTSNGCTSCRACQAADKYECVINDDAKPVLARMADADVIIMATPLYFFGPSAQLKLIIDRMFSLYKWDNSTGAFTSPLKGKTLALIVSAFEDAGLDVAEKPFKITAEYTGMKFVSLLVPNAGVSGDVKDRPDVRKKALALGDGLA